MVLGDSLTDPGNAFVLTHQVSRPPYELLRDAIVALAADETGAASMAIIRDAIGALAAGAFLVVNAPSLALASG